MELKFLNTRDIDAYLKKRTDLIIPIGSVEQHADWGLLGTDHLCADGIARAVADKVGALCAPVIAVGMSQHHMEFAGSMTLRPSTLIALLRDSIIGLHRHGFNRFFLINGHGGNIATVNAAFSEIYMEADVRCEIVSWWMFEPVKTLALELFGKWEGYHATPAEISVTLHLHPRHAKPFAKPDLSVGNDNQVFSSRDFRKRYPDGRMASDPSLASAEHGAKLFGHAVDSIAEHYVKFLAI